MAHKSVEGITIKGEEDEIRKKDWIDMRIGFRF